MIPIKINARLFIIGLLLVIASMIIATQYAVTQLGYGYTIVHPADASIRFIGSDNSSDGVRILRVDGDNTTAVALKLVFGNYSGNQVRSHLRHESTRIEQALQAS